VSIRVLSFVVFVALWWTASALSSGAVSVPGPERVVRDLVALIASGELLRASRLSLTALLVGGVASFLVGLPLGVLMGVRKALAEALDMYFSGLYVTPMSAVVPVLVLWFGFEFPARATFVFLFTLPQVVIVAYQGARNTPRLFLDVARSFGASERWMFWNVIIPHEVPFIITALRLGVGRAIQGMVVAELLMGGTQGIGYIIAVNSASLNLSSVLGVILVVMAFGILATGAVGRIEKAALPK
jgi:NitT/TauT family transport system permease protein